MARVRRRDFLRAMAGAAAAPGLLLGLWASPRAARAQGVLAAELAWGGLGFAVAENQVNLRFPHTVAALQAVGGTQAVVAALVASLEASYLGGQGKVRSLYEALDAGEYLVFAVSFDYEQVIETPAVDDPGIDDTESFLFCQAQVLYVEPPPATGAGGGDFRVLYSFPFRVQYNYRGRRDDAAQRIAEFSRSLMANERSMVATFRNNVAARQFREKAFPRALRVSRVAFGESFIEALRYVQIEREFNEELVGNAFSSSLAETGGLSVIPFRANQLLGITLASRFKRADRVLKLAATMGDKELLDYYVVLEMHKMVRKVSGETQANIRIARGMSCFVNIHRAADDQLLFRKKISLLTDVVLDRVSFSKALRAFDLRYMIQMLIVLFDGFVEAAVLGRSERYEQIGLSPQADRGDMEVARGILLQCAYNA